MILVRIKYKNVSWLWLSREYSSLHLHTSRTSGLNLIFSQIQYESLLTFIQSIRTKCYFSEFKTFPTPMLLKGGGGHLYGFKLPKTPFVDPDHIYSNEIGMVACIVILQREIQSKLTKNQRSFDFYFMHQAIQKLQLFWG